MSVYTVQDGQGRKQTFEGFRKHAASDPLIAVVSDSGFHEIWSLDNRVTGYEELLRYYRDLHGEDAVTITVYERNL